MSELIKILPEFCWDKFYCCFWSFNQQTPFWVGWIRSTFSLYLL